MYQPINQMSFPLESVLAHISEREEILSNYGFVIDKMRQDAEEASQDGLIRGDQLQQVFGVFTSEFIITQC